MGWRLPLRREPVRQRAQRKLRQVQFIPSVSASRSHRLQFDALSLPHDFTSATTRPVVVHSKFKNRVGSCAANSPMDSGTCTRIPAPDHSGSVLNSRWGLSRFPVNPVPAPGSDSVSNPGIARAALSPVAPAIGRPTGARHGLMRGRKANKHACLHPCKQAHLWG